jgi:hypothetical protein
MLNLKVLAWVRLTVLLAHSYAIQKMMLLYYITLSAVIYTTMWCANLLVTVRPFYPSLLFLSLANDLKSFPKAYIKEKIVEHTSLQNQNMY